MGGDRIRMTNTWLVFGLPILLCVVPLCVNAYMTPNIVKHQLKSFEMVDVNDSKDFHVFCRAGDPRKLSYYFRSAMLRIISTAEDIKLLKGYSVDDVKRKYEETPKLLLWAANLLPYRTREAAYPTFNNSCVGITSGKGYSAMLIIRPLDFWNLALLAAGLSLFFLAPKLSRSTAFFYSSGTLVGAIAAALLLLFFLRKILPVGRASTLTMTALSTIFLYWAGEAMSRFHELLHQQLPYIIVYLSVGGLVAFITCYRIGPPTHPRTIDIINWSLQACSLVLIHLSSDLVEVSTTIIALMLGCYLFGSRTLDMAQKWWRRRFPPVTKLLTEQEYIAQGAVETQRGLAELRKFCNSPDCESWKLVTRLKDPRRFSSFIQGDSHLSDSEMMDYGEETENEESGEEYASATTSPRPGSTTGTTLSNGHRNNSVYTDDESD